MILDDIGEYHLIDELGSDGVSALYHAEDTQSGEPVLLRLYESALDPSSYIPDLEWRSRVLPAWSEPDVVYISGWGATESGQPYLIMPYTPGRTLAAHFSTESTPAIPSDPAAALQLIHRLAVALRAGLRLGIVHKDLQPGQILIRPDQSPALLGLDLPEALTTADIGGRSTWNYYHSPEQRQDKTMDARSNIYSLGVLLYDLLGGAAARRNVSDPLPPLELLRPGLSEEIYHLADKSTQEEEWLRYASYDELEEALNLALLAEGSDPIAMPVPVAGLAPATGREAQPAAAALPVFLRTNWQPLLVLLTVLIFVGAILLNESRQPPEADSGEVIPVDVPAGGEGPGAGQASPTPTPTETGTRSTAQATSAGGADATVSPTPTALLSPTVSATPTLPPTATLLPPLLTATPTPTATTAPPTATNTQPPPPPATATPTEEPPTPTQPPPTATNTEEPPPPPPPEPTDTSEPPATATEEPPATATPPVPTVAPGTATPAPPTPTAPPPGVRE